MLQEDDDDDEDRVGAYEDGYWVWDKAKKSLEFVSNPVPIAEGVTLAEEVHNASFRCDVDLVEQARYRRRFRRKPKPNVEDVITLQDVKDLAIYTAPANIVTPMTISMLHTPTIERFLRALILYCGFYLQICEVMKIRKIEMQTKIRTEQSQVVEDEFMDDLTDLRALIAKEYSLMLIGTHETKKFHHMGARKLNPSLTDKDGHFYESLFRFAVQIVWLALARRGYNIIEVEIQRLFKSHAFNIAEHKLKTHHHASMSIYERNTLLGSCFRDKASKLNIKSPAMDDLYCHRPLDFRILGLGIIKYKRLSSRLGYFLMALTGPEEELVENNVILGILGQPRDLYDTMLVLLPPAPDKKSASIASRSSGSVASRRSITSSAKEMKKSMVKRAYPDIVLPQKNRNDQYFPAEFPQESVTPPSVDRVQYHRWLNKVKKQKFRMNASRSCLTIKDATV